MVLIVILVFLAAVTTGVTGLVLFIVGLVKRRPGMWGTGLGLGVLAMILLVVGIAGTIGTAVGKKTAKARINAAAGEISLIRAAVDTFEVDCGRYPTSEEGLQALVAAPAGLAGWHGPYLNISLFADPWHNAYVYRCPGLHNPRSYDLHSLGPDGLDGTEDDIDNWHDK